MGKLPFFYKKGLGNFMFDKIHALQEGKKVQPETTTKVLANKKKIFFMEKVKTSRCSVCV